MRVAVVVEVKRVRALVGWLRRLHWEGRTRAQQMNCELFCRESVETCAGIDLRPYDSIMVIASVRIHM